MSEVMGASQEPGSRDTSRERTGSFAPQSPTVSERYTNFCTVSQHRHKGWGSVGTHSYRTCLWGQECRRKRHLHWKCILCPIRYRDADQAMLTRTPGQTQYRPWRGSCWLEQPHQGRSGSGAADHPSKHQVSHAQSKE
jgi:hypothetical protein